MTRATRCLIGATSLLAALAAPVTPRPGSAQPTTQTYRVAIVLTTSPLAEMAGPEPSHPLTRTILRELRALGYAEGRNLIVERRSAEGRPERYPDIIAEQGRDAVAAGRRQGAGPRRGAHHRAGAQALVS